MALKTCTGDLLKNAKGRCLIVHGVNAQGKMGSGFAEKLRNIYPQAYQAYKRVEELHGLRAGDISIATFANGMIIVNAVTQEFYGRDPKRVYVDYAAVRTTLLRIASFAKERDLAVHLPLIGGGQANGNREVLVRTFEMAFANVDATLWLN